METPKTLSISEIKIRKARLEDAAAISSLIIPLLKKYVSHEFTPQAQITMLNTMSESKIAENISRDFEYYLAEYGPKEASPAILAGVIGMKGKDHLFHLFVAERFHRAGIGNKLWHFMLSQNNESQFTVYSSRFAVAFYQKLGFQSIGEPMKEGGVLCYPMAVEVNR
ncbi:GNAT family N-acetyltransferase [Aliikangiella coralliicola]|uniref:GNAT family N-acetyltransferase n=1 Tax=Aliikangiella coralliicola TaxID=2592383 RepID=A0A545UFV9_9GAMM|nr:GNAT family N-acetyltransferase [Aliikangiella coralliicola]TQV88366.1 GNAT family N-acetyltransferase [Aliikangiella coralliicola]